jgi:hypothetical protein
VKLWLGALAGALGLYGLHRLALRLEARGWIRYRQAGRGGPMAGVLRDLEIHVRPQIRHVDQVKQERAEAPDPEDEPPGGVR